MLYRISFLLVFFCCYLSTSVTAQTVDTFSSDLNTFMSELDDYISLSNRTEAKKHFNEFQKTYKNGIMTDEELTRIQIMSNDMRKKKMKGYPHFDLMIKAILAVQASEQKERYFFKWLLVTESYLEQVERGKFSAFERHLRFTEDLFKYNELLHAQPGGINWKLDTTVFEIDYDVEKKEPYLRAEGRSLLAIRKEDTIIIKNTSGVYYPNTFNWIGKSGEVDWSRHGTPDTYVKFSDFKINFKKGKYTIDTVNLFLPEYYKGSKKGRFTDQLVTGQAKEKFPKFESYEATELKKVLADNIDYYGKFKQFGTNFIGQSNDEYNKSRMEFFNEKGELDLRAYSNAFTLKKGEKIFSQDTKVSLYFDSDSIYHPSVTLIYDIEKKKLNMVREGAGSSLTPFYDSYHQMDLKTKNIVYNSGTDSIEIGTKSIGVGKSSGSLEMESFNYFSEPEYRRLQNIDNMNPIAMLYRMSCDEFGILMQETHNANDIAVKMNPKYSISTIQGMLFDLMEGGFIYYNVESEEVTIKEKLIHYAKAAPKRHRERREGEEVYDYDIIKIYSDSKETNAVLSISDKTLYTEGVSGVVLSDSQLVVMRPYEQKIRVKENRDINFDGRIYGGYLLFFGNNFDFSYDDYNVNLDTVQFIDMMIPTGDVDNEGNKILKPVNASLEDLQGILHIDKPDNKSSLVDHPEYPIFESLKTSYVYYDKKSIQGGAYNRDSFFFEMTPFIMDSLDNLDADDLGFEGTFNSGGIFPEFDEKLTIQNDLGLGFTREAPPEGFPMYGGKATYKNDIILDNSGLTGEGTLEYLSVTMESDSMLFLPDRLKADAQRLYGEESEDFGGVPKVDCVDSKVDWHPNKDSMSIYSTRTPHVMYEGDHTLEGNLVVRPQGMKGEGIFDWPDAIMRSEELIFRTNGVSSPKTYLGLKALTDDYDEMGNKKLVLSTNDVTADMNFDTRKAVFKANTTDVNTELPFVMYKTSMNQGGWDLDNQSLSLKEGEEVQREKAKFISTHPKQDSLEFEGEFADYDLVNNTLVVTGVEFIETADAYVYPPDGVVEIGIGANMQTFENAKILCSTTNKNHEIVKATVDIKGKYDYAASGFYVYNVGTKEQEIELSNITVGRDRKLGKERREQIFTQANGKVGQFEDFYIDEKIAFKGDVYLKALTKNLDFKGYARLLNPHVSNENSWFFINTPIDRKDVSISYTEPVNAKKEKVFVGFRQNAESKNLYSMYMTPPVFRTDKEFFSAKGLLKYDATSDKFLFGDSLKVIGEAKKGNLMTLNNATLEVKTEGIHDFYTYLDDGLKTTFIGMGTASAKDSTYEFDAYARLNMGVPEKLMDMLYEDLYSLGLDLREIDYNKIDDRMNELGMYQIFHKNEKYAEEQYNNIKNQGFFELPKKYFPDFIVNGLEMKWDQEYGSFYSSGKRVGIPYVGKKLVNKMCNGYLEIKLDDKASEELNLFLEITNDMYYYFNLTSEGELRVFSHNPLFMEAAAKLKKKEGTFKVGDSNYNLVATTLQDAEFFKRRMKAAQGFGARPSEMEDLPEELDLPVEEEIITPEGSDF